MKKSDIKLNKNILALISISVILFIIYIRHIKKLGILFVLDDEFGYWANAAYFNGIDWSGTASKIFYYSYGYSILLIPFFWIFKNAIYMYKAAIVLNAIMLVISFLLCYGTAKKLFNKINNYILIVISFIISMYPSYIININIAWSECTLILVFWLLTYLFVDIVEKPSNFRLSLIGILSVYIFMVHKRAIGILIAGFLVIILMKIMKKLDWKRFAFYLVPALVLLVLHYFIDSDLQANLYLNNASIINNTFSGQIDKIKSFFSIDGFINIIKIFAGQFFYLGISTGLLYYFSLYYLIRNILLSIKKKDTSNKMYFYIFMLFTSLFTIAISVIFMSDPYRIDHILYGRYNEMFIGPMILIGGLSFANKDNYITKALLSKIIICFGFLAIIVRYILKGFNFISNFSINTSCLIVQPTPQNSYNVYISAFVSIIICICIYISFNLLSNKKFITVLTIILISTIYFYIGENITKKDIISVNKSRLEINSVVSIIKESDTIPVYYLWDGKKINNRISDCYQFLLQKDKLYYLTNKELEKIEGNVFVITGSLNDIFKISRNYDLIMIAQNSCLLFVNNSDQIADNTKINLPLRIFNKSNLVDDHIIQSNGASGFFMYGPYINLQHGNYKFIMEIELINFKYDNLGFIDIFSGSEGKVFFKKEIYKSYFDNNKLTLELPLLLETDVDGLELRTYANEGSLIKVDKIFLHYLENEIALNSDVFTKSYGKTINGEYLYIQSNGKEGIFMYGPYIKIKKGIYNLSLDIEFIDCKNQELGWIDVYSHKTGREFYKQIIYMDDFVQNKLSLDALVEIDIDISDLEIRAYANDGTQIRISNVNLKLK